MGGWGYLALGRWACGLECQNKGFDQGWSSRKGCFSKGGFHRVECRAQGNKKYPRILGPAVHLELRAPQPREAYILKKSLLKKPFAWFLSYLRSYRYRLLLFGNQLRCYRYSRMKRWPKEQVFRTDAPRTSGVIRVDVLAQKLWAGPRNFGKTSIGCGHPFREKLKGNN